MRIWEIHAFRNTYGIKAAYYAGAMAGAIASEELVIALSKAGLLASFGAGGCPPARVEAAVAKIQAALLDGPYAFNLLHSPNEPALEQRTADLYIRNNVPVIEASAYLNITYALVNYRVSGLRFMLRMDPSTSATASLPNSPAKKSPAISYPQPQLTLWPACSTREKSLPSKPIWRNHVPMADDITVEADSGGHTDNRPLVCLMPTMLALRDELQAKV